MSDFKLWSPEYHQDLINRKIKNEIDMMIFFKEDRKPTKKEYLEWFEKFRNDAKCTVYNADIGVYDADESKWYQEAT